MKLGWKPTRTIDDNIEEYIAWVKNYPDAKSLSKATQNKIEKIIHSCGFYRQKAKSLISMANDIEEKFHGNHSGNGSSLKLDEKNAPIENSSEVFIKRYRYSTSEPNLLLEEIRPRADRVSRRRATPGGGQQNNDDYGPRHALPVTACTRSSPD